MDDTADTSLIVEHWARLDADEQWALVRLHVREIIPCLAEEACHLGMASPSNGLPQAWVGQWAPDLLRAMDDVDQGDPAAWATVAEGLLTLQTYSWLWVGQMYPTHGMAIGRKVQRMNALTFAWSSFPWPTEEASGELPVFAEVRVALQAIVLRQQAEQCAATLEADVPQAVSKPTAVRL